MTFYEIFPLSPGFLGSAVSYCSPLGGWALLTEYLASTFPFSIPTEPVFWFPLLPRGLCVPQTLSPSLPQGPDWPEGDSTVG